MKTLYSSLRVTALLVAFVIQPDNFSIAQSQRPNIIYIMADDMGFGDLSCYGRNDYQTPNLDRLASQGMKFINAYSASPICTPTRTAFMTGRYPARTQVGLLEPLRDSVRDSLIGLDPLQPTLPRLLKQSGYTTALIGKWHLGVQPANSPLALGFDEFFGFLAGATDYISHTRNRLPALYENEKIISKEGYLTDLLTDRTIEYLSRPHKQPFFLSLQFNAPHWPWQGPGAEPYPDTMRWRNGGNPLIYASMMKSLDDAIGKIMAKINEAGLYDNTVVIFTSDNGGERFSNMGIYTGKKAQVWEGGIRVPAFIRWPNHIPEKSTTTQVIITMDWTATILALAEAKSDPVYPLDGISLIPISTGKQKEELVTRCLFWRLYQDNSQKAIRDGKWKYLEDESGEYLFDLIADPSEKKDVKIKHARELMRLKTKYSRWEKEVLVPLPL